MADKTTEVKTPKTRNTPLVSRMLSLRDNLTRARSSFKPDMEAAVGKLVAQLIDGIGAKVKADLDGGKK